MGPTLRTFVNAASNLLNELGKIMRRARRILLHGRVAFGEGHIGATGILPVAATPGSYSFAHRRLSRRRPRGSAALPLVATSYDPPGERGAGGLTVAQRWRSPRCGNAQDARCSSDHAQAGGRWMNHDHAFFRNGKSHSLRKRRSVPKKIISGRAKPAPLESLMPMRSIVHAKSAA